MSNEKEREKAKQKNIAVIENAIAARNKVRVFTAQKSSSIISRFLLFLKISFFSLKSKEKETVLVLFLFLFLFLFSLKETSEKNMKRKELPFKARLCARTDSVLCIQQYCNSINLSRMTD